ncbi:MAG: hypothetical protein K8R59_11295 [Thermoanaerobaculales bacterium]|nr:hypothetical protein [Thermoanaerobaculales bacterium]
MKTRRIVLCILAFGWTVMASADGDQSLRDAFAVQSRLYNAESDRYLAARQRDGHKKAQNIR